ncbi:MAG: hypothetical protein Q9168_007755 [Polycauliona sp. 1 TL-2023]
MTSLEGICDLLGRSWAGVQSKGRPAFILKHLQAFSKEWLSISDKELVGTFFLDHLGKKLFNHAECSTKLPEDRSEILKLVTEAFVLLSQPQPLKDKCQTMQSQTPDSTLTAASEEPIAPPISDIDAKRTSAADMVDEQSEVKTEEKWYDPVSRFHEGSDSNRHIE